MASSHRSRGSEVKDGRFDDVSCSAAEVGPNYPSLAVISLLTHMGILLFCFHYKWNHRVVVGDIPLPPPLL
jgi:hypothetical protein